MAKTITPEKLRALSEAILDTMQESGRHKVVSLIAVAGHFRAAADEIERLNGL